MHIAHISDEQRGKGHTTQQLKDAKLGALFIWCNSRIDYPKALARHLGREDIKIVSPSVLECNGERLRGLTLPEIILDHACVPDEREWDVIERARNLTTQRG